MLFASRAVRAVCFAAVLSLAVAGCSASETSPEPPPSVPPSSHEALPVPTTTAQVLTVAAEVLRTASYRFTVDYAVPAHREHTIDLPDCVYRAAGHADATARTVRAVTLGGGRCGVDIEELVIAEQTWMRKREGDVPWGEWVAFSSSAGILNNLTPWLIAERLNNATDLTGTMTEVRGRVDLSVREGEETRLADRLLGHLGIANASDVAFTLTVDPDARPTAFAFELPFEEGVLTVDHAFGEYGLTVTESPPVVPLG